MSRTKVRVNRGNTTYYIQHINVKGTDHCNSERLSGYHLQLNSVAPTQWYKFFFWYHTGSCWHHGYRQTFKGLKRFGSEESIPLGPVEITQWLTACAALAKDRPHMAAYNHALSPVPGIWCPPLDSMCTRQHTWYKHAQEMFIHIQWKYIFIKSF